MSKSPFEPEQDPQEGITVSENKLEVSVTLKAGTGYDAPWIVAKGPRDEVAAFIGLEAGAKLSAFNAQVPKLAKHFHDKAEEVNPK